MKKRIVTLFLLALALIPVASVAMRAQIMLAGVVSENPAGCESMDVPTI